MTTSFLTRFCDWLNRQIANLTAILLFSMLIFSACAVFFRYVMGDALNWASDIILPAFVWMALLGTSIAYRLKAHIHIDSLQNLLKHSLKKKLNSFIHLTLIAFSFYLTIQGVKIVLATRAMPWGILQLPPTYFYVAFPISFLIISLYAIDDFLIGIRGLEHDSEHS